ncbi:MAG: hypothetical protein HYX47_09005 [Burkholderiales bacterium]|nr:hypothetical protein [Burkholderiales bacterium]
MRSFFKFLGMMLFSAWLAGCGGGSSDSGAGSAQPVAAGTARGVFGAPRQEEKYTTLNAQGSFDPAGHTLTFAWALVGRPAGSTRGLQNADTVNAWLDPDMPGDYTASLVVSNGTVQSQPTLVPFTVIPDPVWFNNIDVVLHNPNDRTESGTTFVSVTEPKNWYVTTHALSNYPAQVQMFFNGVSQGVKTDEQRQNLVYSTTTISRQSANFAYSVPLFPIAGYPGGDYTVTMVISAGGRSTSTVAVLTFPACDAPGAVPGPLSRPCPPN